MFSLLHKKHLRAGSVFTFLITAAPQLPGPDMQATAETAYAVFEAKRTVEWPRNGFYITGLT